MQMSWIYLGLGLLTGAVFATQGAVNGRLAAYLGSTPLAALVSFTVGWSILMLINLATRPSLPTLDTVATIPWWAYLGGLIGAIGVTSAAFSVPQIGVATWVACVIAGQLVCALFLDQYGAFGQVIREISPGRLAGAALLAAGVYCMRRF